MFDPRLLLHQPTLYSCPIGSPACSHGNFQLLIHPGGPPDPSKHFQEHRPPMQGELCACNLAVCLGMLTSETILGSSIGAFFWCTSKYVCLLFSATYIMHHKSVCIFSVCRSAILIQNYGNLSLSPKYIQTGFRWFQILVQKTVLVAQPNKPCRQNAWRLKTNNFGDRRFAVKFNKLLATYNPKSMYKRDPRMKKLRSNTHIPNYTWWKIFTTDVNNSQASRHHLLVVQKLCKGFQHC